jgi:small-conductance mechanosensitive channel
VRDTPATKIARVSEALKGTATGTLVRRPNFRRAMYSGLGALVALLIGSTIGRGHGRTFGIDLTVVVPTLVFVVLAIVCVRATAAELDEFFRWRGGHTTGSAVRMVVTGSGYVLAALIALALLSVPIGHLLLGGAIVGVVLGIAAQQSLANVFAGLVLLAARPFTVGSLIRVRSGALGGEFYGTVLAMSLTYVSISTSDGMLQVPNSSVLAAAVGPWHPKAVDQSPGPAEATAAPAPSDRRA